MVCGPVLFFFFPLSHIYPLIPFFLDQLLQLFPEAYTKKLMELQDGIEPMPFELVEGVVRQELLDGAPLSDLFLTFDKEPLGAASIASLFKVWGKGKGRRFIERVAKKLPEGLRAKVLEAELRRMERQE